MKASVKAFRILSALFLLAFSVYALLDTFLIPRVYACVESPAAAAEESCRARTLSAAVGESEKEPQITENSYSDGSLSVEISSYRVEDTTVYVADIRIEDPETLRTAFSQNSYGRNITAVSSETAESVGAVLAVNGDNYGSREKGYVIRNGVLYRELAASDQEDLVIWSDGSFSIIREAEISAPVCWRRASSWWTPGTRWTGPRPAIPAPPWARSERATMSWWSPTGAATRARD